MITWYFDGGRLLFFGKSTDTKPTTFEVIAGKQEKIPNGTPLYLMDTKKAFMFDAEDSQWLEQ